MFRTLVVPLDGSDLAEQAIPYAVKLAQNGRGGLILARAALGPPPVRLDGADWEQEQSDAVEAAERYLADVAGTLDSDVQVSTQVGYGHAASQIISIAADSGADAIVMATHGRTGLAHLLYGSVAEAILADSHVPVFLVRAQAGEARQSPFEPKTARLLVPLDGSPFAEAALQTAVDFLDATGELVLLRVAEEPDHVERDQNGRVLAYLDQQEEARTREARDYLVQVARKVADQHPQIRMRLDVRIGGPVTGIGVAALANQSDLIVMATRGRTGVRRAIVGSVAGAVLCAGHTPVLLVHPQVQSSVPIGAP